MTGWEEQSGYSPNASCCRSAGEHVVHFLGEEKAKLSAELDTARAQIADLEARVTKAQELAGLLPIGLLAEIGAVLRGDAP